MLSWLAKLRHFSSSLPLESCKVSKHHLSSFLKQNSQANMSFLPSWNLLLSDLTVISSHFRYASGSRISFALERHLTWEKKYVRRNQKRLWNMTFGKEGQTLISRTKPVYGAKMVSLNSLGLLQKKYEDPNTVGFR